MNGSCHILLRSDSESRRAEFRRTCREQGMSMTTALNIVMQEVIDGKIVLTQGAKVRKKKVK